MRVSNSLNFSTVETAILSPQLRAEALTQSLYDALIKSLDLGIGERTFARLIDDRDRQAVLCFRKRARFQTIERLHTNQFGNTGRPDCLMDFAVLGPFVQQD